MHIRTVEYRRLRSFGSFQNETVGAVAAVAQGETPEAALSALREWVAGQLALACDAGELERRGADMDAPTYAKVRAILAANGVDLPECPESPSDDLPF